MNTSVTPPHPQTQRVDVETPKKIQPPPPI